MASVTYQLHRMPLRVVPPKHMPSASRRNLSRTGILPARLGAKILLLVRRRPILATRQGMVSLSVLVFFIGLMCWSFIRMVNDPDLRRSDLPISTVENTLSSEVRRDTQVTSVRLEQGNISYEVGGKGRNIVLIHCWAGSKEYWKWTIQALTPHFRIYALDLKGFGDSDKPDDGYTMADFSQLIAEFFNALGISKAILVGHSMGGKIAVSFAQAYPDKVDKLVLVGIPTKKISLGLRMFTLPIIGKPWYWLVRKIGYHTLEPRARIALTVFPAGFFPGAGGPTRVRADCRNSHHFGKV